MMDPINDVLDTMHIGNSRYFRVEARAPWGIEFHPRDAAHLMIIASGSCWLTTTALDHPLKLASGDCFLIQTGVDFTLQHDLADRAVSCETVMYEVAVTHGGDGDLTEVLFGRFPVDSLAAEPLMTRLPPIMALDLDGPSCQALHTTFDLIAREWQAGDVGSRLITSRLADVLFLQALRAACNTAVETTPSWLTAIRDPNLAAAIHAMHADLSRPWTVEALAQESHMSRSAFAAAFKTRTGDTPLGYLTSWRIYRAKSLLRDTPLSLHQIAVRIGYDTGAAFSRAFARQEGLPPGAWRREHANI